MRRVIPILFTFLFIFLSACSNNSTDENGTNDKKANIQFSINRYLLKEHIIKLNFNGEYRLQKLSNQDFKNRKAFQGNIIATPQINTPPNGTLIVNFKLLDTKTEQLLSKGSFKIGLKEDWGWGVFFRVDSIDADPMYGCMGCMYYVSFSIDQAALDSTSFLKNDSIYAVVGGNSISHPVIY